MQFSLILLSHPDRVPNHLSMFQASRDPVSMNPLSLRKLIMPLAMTPKNISTLSRGIGRKLLIPIEFFSLGFGDLDAIRMTLVLRYQVLFPGTSLKDREVTNHKRVFLYSLYEKPFMPGTLLARSSRTNSRTSFTLMLNTKDHTFKG